MENYTMTLLLWILVFAICEASPKSNYHSRLKTGAHSLYHTQREFTIDMLLFIDTKLEARLKDESIRTEEYISEFIDEINKILGQLIPPGRVNLTANKTLDSAVERRIRVWSDPFMGGLASRNLLRYTERSMPSVVNSVDMMMLLSGRKMTAIASPREDKQVTGLAWRASACGTLKSVVVTDVGSAPASAVIAAHEFGHALGSPHDGEGESKGCPEGDLYLMAPRGWDDRKTVYSLCSMRAINSFLKTQNANCLFGEGYRNPSKEEDELYGTRLAMCQLSDSKGLQVVRIEPGLPCKFACAFYSSEDTANEAFVLMGDRDGTPCNKRNSSQKCKDMECL